MISNLEIGNLIKMKSTTTVANLNLVSKQENGLFNRTYYWNNVDHYNIFCVVKIFAYNDNVSENYCILFNITNNEYYYIEYGLLNAFQFQKIE